jgi:GTP-binding protein HflX
LVEAFHATLEEATHSDFLIHVLDASHPRVGEFYNTTMEVLADLGADTKQTLVVFNKMDRVEDDSTRVVLRRHFPEAVFVSAHSGGGFEELVDRIGEFVSTGTRRMEFRFPLDRADLLARLHREGTVHETEYLDDAVLVQATMRERSMAGLAEFRPPRGG